MVQRTKTGRVDDNSPCEHGVSSHVQEPCVKCAGNKPGPQLLDKASDIMRDNLDVRK